MTPRSWIDAAAALWIAITVWKGAIAPLLSTIAALLIVWFLITSGLI